MQPRNTRSIKKSTETKLLRALKEIQKECARYYEPQADASQRIQNIWRTANFAIHDAENKK